MARVKYSIGIDIGGTNTDGVIIDQNEVIVAAHKTQTTEYVADGFRSVIRALLQESSIAADSISMVAVGTTHATNALLQRKNLARVGVIRIAGHKPLLPPCYAWPEDLQKTILGHYIAISGGFECDGSLITSMQVAEIESAVQELVAADVHSIAIIGVFSPLYSTQEEYVASIIRTYTKGKIPVTVSHRIGGIGFIERENSTILNAALIPALQCGFAQLLDELKTLHIQAPLFVTQNNGTLITVETACEYPVFTMSAGPTNSCVGGVKLAGLQDALLIDIGGTSTDIGCVLQGFARRSVDASEIGGVRLNFAMPDVVSLPLGGGSYVSLPDLLVGPQSAAKNLIDEAYCCGGQRLTFTDVSVVAGICTSFQNNYSIPLDKLQADMCMKRVMQYVAEHIVLVAGAYVTLPIVLVGGGASLYDINLLAQLLPGRSCIIPTYASVANAYGAALAERSVTIDTVVVLDDQEALLSKMRDQAYQKLKMCNVQENTMRCIEEQIIPYHYVPGNKARIIITVAAKGIC